MYPFLLLLFTTLRLFLNCCFSSVWKGFKGIIHEAALLHSTVCINHLSLAMTPVVHEITFVLFAASECIYSLPGSHIVLEVTFVYISICKFHHTMTILMIECPFAVVDVTF